MIIKSWDELPDYMKVQEVKPYYDKLARMKWQLILKRIFDVFVLKLLSCFPNASGSMKERTS